MIFTQIRWSIGFSSKIVACVDTYFRPIKDHWVGCDYVEKWLPFLIDFDFSDFYPKKWSMGDPTNTEFCLESSDVSESLTKQLVPYQICIISFHMKKCDTILEIS